MSTIYAKVISSIDLERCMKTPLCITTGEPSGIGMDIVADVLVHHQDIFDRAVIVLADKGAFIERMGQLGMIGQIQWLSPSCLNTTEFWQHMSQGVYCVDLPCKDKVRAGVLSVANASMVAQQLALAHELAITKKVSAIVTAPLQKSVMIQADIKLENGEQFSGHTEYFMHKSSVDKVVMMLANSVMKVALVTTHLPLKDVPSAISAREIANTVQITYDELVQKFAIKNPKILVCGLNPHAGEGGYLGTEEMEIINPVLRNFQDAGMDISLALPADTLFTPSYLERCDAVIAMYHDQGLAPLKSHGFGDTVNITLGLPYVRTSVDHGTALSLAATGQASSSSLRQAIRYAQLMA